MATQKTNRSQTKKASSDASTNNVSWVNITLTDDMGAEIIKLSEDAEKVAALFVQMGLSGGTISLKWVDSAQSACASFVASDEHANGQLRGLSGWSDVAFDAVVSLVYKWYVVLDKSWPEVTETGSRRFR